MKVQEPNVHADPLVSIIVTNYNYGNFLSNAIDSALGQCYQPVEVIVVDDGSTDDSQDVINGYGTRVQPIFKQNGGQASAMNIGFRQSRGEIVIFLDTDDMLLTGIVQSVVKAFQMQQNVTKVMYRMEVIDAKGRLTGEIRPNPHLPLRSGDLSRQTLSFPFDMTWMATSGNAFAAQALRKILPIPEHDYPIMADFYLSHLAPLLGLGSGEKLFFHFAGRLVREDGVIPAWQHAMRFEIDKGLLFFGNVLASCIFSSIQISSTS